VAVLVWQLQVIRGFCGQRNAANYDKIKISLVEMSLQVKVK